MKPRHTPAGLAVLVALGLVQLIPARGSANVVVKTCGQRLALPKEALDLEGMSQSIEEISTTARNQENGGVEETPAETGVSIVANKDTSAAMVTLAWPRKGGPQDGRFVASVTTPVKKADPTTEVLTRGGLVEDVSLSLGWKRQWFNEQELLRIDFFDLHTRQEALCSHFSVPKESHCSSGEFEKALEAWKGDPGKKRIDIGCLLRQFSAAAPGNSDQAIGTLLRVVPLHYFEVVGKTGRTEREYFTQQAAKREDDRLSFSFSGTYGRIFSRSRLTGSIGIQRRFKEGAPVRLCQPAEGAPDLESCAEHPLDRAKRIDSVPVTIEYRFWAERLAASPSVSYDFEEEALKASLPLYLVRDDKGKFTGGLRVDWEDGKSTVVSVFVAAPLGL